MDMSSTEARLRAMDEQRAGGQTATAAAAGDSQGKDKEQEEEEMVTGHGRADKPILTSSKKK